MPLCSRGKKVGLVLLMIIIFITIELWISADLPRTKPKYSAEHLKLLRDYKSRRTKKSDKVLILGPSASSTPHEQFRARLHTVASTQTSLNLIKGAKANMSTDTSSATTITDVFIGVKSSGKFHKIRLPLLLDTWIPFARQSTFLITDVDDPDTLARFDTGHYLKTACSNTHHRKGLVCKVSVAYDLFIQNPRRWFCMADDDTYINIPNLVSRLRDYDHTKDWYIGKPSLKYPIRVTIDNLKQSFWFHTGGAGYCISQSLALKMIPYAMGGKLRELADSIRVPDDVAVGYIINRKLGVDITRVSSFHSHLEGLWRIGPHELKDQITLSYGEFNSGPNEVISNIVNTGGLIPTYSPSSDPTRLKSVHCYLFPHARECAKFGVASP